MSEGAPLLSYWDGVEDGQAAASAGGLFHSTGINMTQLVKLNW
jgi:hypothetical protein